MPLVTSDHWILVYQNYADSILFILVLESDGKLKAWFYRPNFLMDNMYTTSVLPVGEWIHVLFVLDFNIGQTWYINGVKDSFYNISIKQQVDQRGDECLPVYIWTKTPEGAFSTHSALDEIKYMYISLTEEG